MPESDEVAKDIKEMKWRLESLDSTQHLMIRADRDKYLEVAKHIIGRSQARVRVYRNIDGERSQTKLASDLGMQNSNLSKYIKTLREGGLIEIKRIARDGSKVYKKSKWERLLSISQWLQIQFPQE